MKNLWCVIVAVITCMLLNAASLAAPAETKYLLFQIFTYPSDEARGSQYFPGQGSVQSTERDILQRIGTTGDKAHKLGICLGPLALCQSDEDIRNIIKHGFDAANEHDLAIAFHIDDQMFWTPRPDLEKGENIEWIDWRGRECAGRKLDWGPTPAKAPPQLCLNSPGVQSAIKARAKFIAREIEKHLTNLRTAHREELFAGVFAGWETMIGRDYDSGKRLGFHALRNRGLDEERGVAEQDRALVEVVREHMQLWANSLADAGIPRNKIYCHIAFMDPMAKHAGQTVLETEGFAPPDVAFDKAYRPGFSTYPMGNTIEQIVSQVKLHGDPPWVSAEGTNVVPNGIVGEASMESYLGKMFNHGASIVNVFSWGIGGEPERDKNLFRRVTENDEAIGAYRKFLTGQALVERPRSQTGLSADRLRDKIHRIQAQLPGWVMRTRRQHEAEAIMYKLDQALKSGDLQTADRTADEVLKMLAGP